MKPTNHGIALIAGRIIATAKILDGNARTPCTTSVHLFLIGLLKRSSKSFGMRAPLGMLQCMLVALCLTQVAAAQSALSQRAPTLSANDTAAAYGDLIGHFWVGAANDGRWVETAESKRVDLWQVAVATNSMYSYWTITGSVDAKTRIRSVWKWAKTYYGRSGLTSCGAHSPANFALDDTTSDINFMLEIYEITGDADALTSAKEALDCATTRWQDGGTAGCTQDGTPAGGLWYNDSCKDSAAPDSVKTVVAAHFALDNYWYYQLSGDASYRSRAVELDDWIALNLQRLPGASGSHPRVAIHASPCPYPSPPYVDGLYWTMMDHNGSTPEAATPCQVAERGSATSLVNNMAAAVLLARLYNDPLTKPSAKAAYRSRMIVGSQGIRTYETGCGTGGYQQAAGCHCTRDKHDVFVDDKDAHGNGWFAVMYVREVLPIIAGQPRVLVSNNFTRTAEMIRLQDRYPDGSYGGSWTGPPDNTNCWGSNESLAVSASTINMIFAGMAAL